MLYSHRMSMGNGMLVKCLVHRRWPFFKIRYYSLQNKQNSHQEIEFQKHAQNTNEKNDLLITIRFIREIR